ncbi:hypothetical protein RIF29_22509 [Crotalaria pallida]|uniref:VQ domain-containing protein n=1 Tax=Crotalaria pallida TaxID=3830 RepID=A0AAN9F537_CROPI
MRPSAKFDGFNEQSKKKMMMINGPRPSPLMINKDSHLIRKPSVSVEKNKVLVVQKQQQQQQRVPIIIYTQSPKVIHTKPQDFMALVQRLTGMSTSSKENIPQQQQQQHQEVSENFGSSTFSDGSYNTTSTITQGASETTCVNNKREDYDDAACVNNKWDVVANVENGMSPNFMRFVADMPLFTPNSSSDFFSPSTRSTTFKCSDNPYGILGSLISPSGLEFMKELPEY